MSEDQEADVQPKSRWSNERGMDKEALVSRSRERGHDPPRPFERVEDWPDPGRGPLWSQKADAVKAIQYAITSNSDNLSTDDYWCDAIIFGQDRITIWINGKMMILDVRIPQKQYPAPSHD